MHNVHHHRHRRRNQRNDNQGRQTQQSSSHSSHSFFSAHNGGQQIHKTDRKGRLLHREIQSVQLQDLGLTDDVVLKEKNLDDIITTNSHHGSTTDNAATTNQTTQTLEHNQLVKGKEPLLQLLHSAGVTDIDDAVLAKLPTWDTIQALYYSGSSDNTDDDTNNGNGGGPVVIGTEQCQGFRQRTPPEDASLGIAGMFNTGTNLMAMYLEANCKMPLSNNKNRGMRWQVPWGKHMFAAFRNNNTAAHDGKVIKDHVLPVVLVRDPYQWMQSLCRNHYAVQWHHDVDKRCPNLVPNDDDYKLFPYTGNHIPVRINLGGNHTSRHYDSLAHLWTDWYTQYVEFARDYPRLMIRYEDVMFYPMELTEQLCECIGGVPYREDGKFTFLVDSAKWGPGHGRKDEKTSLISAMIKYGNVDKRLKGYTEDDLQLAHTALDPTLMELFQYNRPLEHDLRQRRWQQQHGDAEREENIS